MLNSSAPQKRMRRGSNWWRLEWNVRHRDCHDIFVATGRREERSLMATLYKMTVKMLKLETTGTTVAPS